MLLKLLIAIQIQLLVFASLKTDIDIWLNLPAFPACSSRLNRLHCDHFGQERLHPQLGFAATVFYQIWNASELAYCIIFCCRLQFADYLPITRISRVTIFSSRFPSGFCRRSNRVFPPSTDGTKRASFPCEKLEEQINWQLFGTQALSRNAETLGTPRSGWPSISPAVHCRVCSSIPDGVRLRREHTRRGCSVQESFSLLSADPIKSPQLQQATFLDTTNLSFPEIRARNRIAIYLRF